MMYACAKIKYSRMKNPVRRRGRRLGVHKYEKCGGEEGGKQLRGRVRSEQKKTDANIRGADATNRTKKRFLESKTKQTKLIYKWENTVVPTCENATKIHKCGRERLGRVEIRGRTNGNMTNEEKKARQFMKRR